MSEAGELLRIPEDKLQLEAGSIYVEDVSGRHRGVGREEDLTGLTLFVGVDIVNDDNAHFPSETNSPDDGRVQLVH